VGGDDKLFELNPMETIKKVVRKENKEIITLGRCEPTRENTQRCIVFMEDIQRYVVSINF
jgi:hypothetical protein